MTLLLLGFRYRLLWAQVRVRRGKIALFFIAYLLACCVGTALLLGGFGAAMASIRLGKAELVARFVLAGFSGIAIVVALVLGIGVTPAFSDAVLRRYPLSAVDRFLARRITAFLDPLWMVLLALFVGLAAGFHAAGVGSIWLGAAAALLFVVVTYLFAQLMAAALGWITSTPAGLMALAALAVILVFALPLRASWGLPVLKVTPAFYAAAVMTGGSATGLWVLLAWCVAAAAAITGVERLPAPSQTTAAARAEWDSPCDRLAAHFGASAPLVAKTLKYYWRIERARLGLLLNLSAFPLMLLIVRPHREAPLLHFFVGMGLMAISGFSATFVMAVNSFGFDGSGFRRYFLLPLPLAAAVRTVSLIPLLLGALPLPFSFALCVVLARVPVDSRMAAMLAANGIGGLCFFHGLALWTSILAPSRADTALRFGNDYSLPANLVGTVGLLAALFGSQFLGMAVGARVLEFWWIAPVFMSAAVIFYAVSYRMAPAVLLARRERILAVVEREQHEGRLIA